MQFSISARQSLLPRSLRVLGISLVGFIASVQAAWAAAPTISGTPATQVYVGSTYYFKPTASDADRQTLKFTIANKPSWASFSSSTGRLTGRPRSVGLWSNIQIKVSDGSSTAALPAFSVRASSRYNSTPTISGTPVTSVKAGVAYSFQPTAKDSNGDPLAFSITNKPSWASFSKSTGRLSGTPTSSHVGTTSGIVISVSDGLKSASLASFSISVTGTSTTNRAPVISGTPPTSATVGMSYSFKPTASDADGDALSFSIQNKPSWASFSTSTGTLSGTPTTSGTHSNIIISVSDGKTQTALSAFGINVVAAPSSNTAPVISGSPSTRVDANTAYSFRPTASDANGDALTFAISGKPSWASFNTSTGQLSGTPSSSHLGSFPNIVISVSDGKVSVALPAFTIDVTQAALGTATLSWVAPTQNTDGTTLTDLAGYRIVYGTSASALSQSVQIANAGVTAYVLDLVPGIYYFAVKAYTSSGAESETSNVVSKVVQ